MEWSDEGIVLSARKYGETSAIVTLLTRNHGVHAGLVRGGSGKRKRGDLQPGNAVAAQWRGRLAEHLGSYTIEMRQAHAALVLDSPDALAGLSAALGVVETSLPEHETHIQIYEGLCILLSAIGGGEEWRSAYVKWELGLLGELGFGLDLSCCAATGEIENLIYVSPKSGRAVSATAGKPYRGAMLPLPPFLLSKGRAGSIEDVSAGLSLTGYFLKRHVFGHVSNGRMPASRQRFAERIWRQAKANSDVT